MGVRQGFLRTNPAGPVHENVFFKLVAAASRRLGPVARMQAFDIRRAHNIKGLQSARQDVIKVNRVTRQPWQKGWMRDAPPARSQSQTHGMSNRDTNLDNNTITGSAPRSTDVMRNTLCSPSLILAPMSATCQLPVALAKSAGRHNNCALTLPTDIT